MKSVIFVLLVGLFVCPGRAGDVLGTERVTLKRWAATKEWLTDDEARRLGLPKLTMEERRDWEGLVNNQIERAVRGCLKWAAEEAAVLLENQRRKLAAAAGAAPAAAAAQAGAVDVGDAQSIDKVAGNGMVIDLLDGSSWVVAAEDRFKSDLWLDSDEVVLVNKAVMIRLSDGEHVRVRPAR